MECVFLAGTHCARAEELLVAHGAPVSHINLSDFPFRKDEMKALTGKRSVPQVQRLCGDAAWR